MNDVDTVVDATTEDLTFTFAYDAEGVRTQVEYPSGAVRVFADDPELPSVLATSFTETRDSEDRLTSVVKPEGTIDYGWDAAGGLASISALGRTTGFDYDFFGRLRTATAPGNTWNWQYSAAGLRERVTSSADRSIETRLYDALGRLDVVTHTDSADEIIFEADYTLGADGNRIAIDETRGVGHGDSTVNWSYEYDPLGRLTREQRINGTVDRNISFEYDVDSNRTKKTDNLDANQSLDYTYYDLSQKLYQIIWAATGIIKETRTYTAEGELSTKVDSSGTTTYFWGPNSTLTSVVLPSGRKIEYDYDENGDRVGRRVISPAGNIESHSRFLVDRLNPTGYSQVIAEIDGFSGAVTTFNTFADELQSQTRVTGGAVTRQAIRSDALGSVRSVTSEGSSTERADYAAFGTLLAGSTVANTAYAFTGQWREEETGLQHHRARWLDTATGAWVSSDSRFDFPLNFGSPYLYIGSSPASQTDILGTFTFAEMLAGLAVLSFVITVAIGYRTGGALGALLAGTAFILAIAFAWQFMVGMLLMSVAITGTTTAGILLLLTIAIPLVIYGLFLTGKASADAFKDGDYVLGTLYASLLVVDIAALGVGGLAGRKALTQAFDSEIPTPVRQVAPLKKFHLVYDKVQKVWKSPEGLIYNSKDPKFGNRVKHVLDHTNANPNKPKHSRFDVPEDDAIKALEIVDEAWSKRAQSGGPTNEGPRDVWDIPMNRTIGKEGEAWVRVVVKKDTSELVSAYVIFAPK